MKVYVATFSITIYFFDNMVKGIGQKVYLIYCKFIDNDRRKNIINLPCKNVYALFNYELFVIFEACKNLENS